jgi:hypothetical protein
MGFIWLFYLSRRRLGTLCDIYHLAGAMFAHEGDKAQVNRVRAGLACASAALVPVVLAQAGTGERGGFTPRTGKTSGHILTPNLLSCPPLAL